MLETQTIGFDRLESAQWEQGRAVPLLLAQRQIKIGLFGLSKLLDVPASVPRLINSARAPGTPLIERVRTR